MDWVFFECKVEHGQQRFVLLAIARHCTSDDGTGAHPSVERLASMVRKDPKTVRRAVAALERVGELVVVRPAVPGRGRYIQYVVVMGRDIEECRLLATGRPGPPSDRQAAAPTDTSELPRSRTTRAAAPVDRATEPPQEGGRVVPSSDRERGAEGGQKGGRRGEPHARSGRRREVEVESRASAARSSAPPARAGPLDPRLQQVRDMLEDAGILVAWDLEPTTQAVLGAQVDVCGAKALVAEALALTAAKGVPRSARAWIHPWELLPAQADAITLGGVQWCGQCEAPGSRFIVDDDARPLHRCPRCHPANITAPPF